ncbi:MAG: hypothetical protein ACD_22C00025G0001 [uncultured bacterium]|nr:MAG: hypothetical protein ACD_22C00025G0001 [uncultured bacterium]
MDTGKILAKPKIPVSRGLLVSTGFVSFSNSSSVYGLSRITGFVFSSTSGSTGCSIPPLPDSSPTTSTVNL